MMTRFSMIFRPSACRGEPRPGTGSIPPRRERMAAQQAGAAPASAPPGAVRPDRLLGVRRAGRLEPAARPEQRRGAPAPAAAGTHEPAPSRTRSIDGVTYLGPRRRASAASSRQIAAVSGVGGRGPRHHDEVQPGRRTRRVRRRTHSRIQRLTRLRTTAPPTFRLTVMPTRPAARERERPADWPRPAAAPAVLDRQVLRAQAHACRPRKALASPLGGTSGASDGQGAYFFATRDRELAAPLAPAAAENFAARRASSCACEIHACACGSCDGAETSSSHDFLRDITVLSRPAGCVPGKAQLHSIRPRRVNAGPGDRRHHRLPAHRIRPVSDGESAHARSMNFASVTVERISNLARAVRASAHGMRLSAIEYGKVRMKSAARPGSSISARNQKCAPLRRLTQRNRDFAGSLSCISIGDNPEKIISPGFRESCARRPVCALDGLCAV